MPEISAATVWTGPPLPAGATWRDDREVAALAAEASARRTPLDQALAAVERFAAAAGPQRPQRLVLLFSGILDILNADRGSIIAGIGRYARSQRALAQKIERQANALARLADATAAAEQSERADVAEMQQWDARIFDERQKALSYVCEQPQLIEQRAFALGRRLSELAGVPPP
ncbi:MAG: hypothetical protein U1E53_09925 [Dongiaceae bacterium]